jgi:hypothetical protein
METQHRPGLARQIVGGIGWTIAILGAAVFAGLIGVIIFIEQHREIYERIPAKSLLSTALVAVLGLGLVLASGRAGRKS